MNARRHRASVVVCLRTQRIEALDDGAGITGRRSLVVVEATGAGRERHDRV